MRVGFVTNLRAPYRTLQLNEFANIKDINLTTYYCNSKREGRKWKINNEVKFKEVDLDGVKLFEKYGYINKGLLDIVKNNDLIIIGSYEQPTYIALSILCRLMKKPYVLLFDGISCDRVYNKENRFKKFIKNVVISNASVIFGNGEVSKQYFNKVFNYPLEKIYNQYLTIDTNKINRLYEKKELYREQYRKALGISEDDKVIIYSGRVIGIKNIDSVIKAISKINKNLVLLITGGGELEEDLKLLAADLNVRLIVTGFIEKQENLFQHYFAGDALILPSLYEPWGLVVNEAMCAGLPVIVSNICGCSKDLVSEGNNGYLINPNNIDDISCKVNKLMYEDNLNAMGDKSRDIIKAWTFENSKNNLVEIIKYISGSAK